MRAALLLLLCAFLAAPAQAAAAADSAEVWDRLIGLYLPGGPLNPRLQDDIEAEEPPSFLDRLLKDPALTPMGPEAGARWFRERLKTLRGPRPPRREGLVGWVVERSGSLEWRTVQTGSQEAR